MFFAYSQILKYIYQMAVGVEDCYDGVCIG